MEELWTPLEPRFPGYFISSLGRLRLLNGTISKVNPSKTVGGYVITGLLGVRKALNPTIMKELKKQNKGFVLEAAFLDPQQLSKFGSVLLLAPSAKEHKKQFFVHRKGDPFHKAQFRTARIIQKYLVTEAQNLDIPISRNGNRI